MSRIIKITDKRGIESTKYLMKKYRLKSNVKAGICLLVFGILIIGILIIQADRVERIDNIFLHDNC